MVKAAIFAAVLCICAWFSLPFGSAVFTLQSMGIFLTLGLLGGKWGTVSIAVYLACGAAGLPVFSGFRGGLGVLLGATGGYLWGFLLAGIAYWILDGIIRKPILALIPAQLVCYLCGTLWYAYGYGGGIWQVLLVCVVPYLVPDGLKFWLAAFLIRRIRKEFPRVGSYNL